MGILLSRRTAWLPVACFTMFAVGCYQYTPPPDVLLGARFLPSDRTATDKILTEIKVLDLATAQQVATMNNQNYQAAFHFVNAARMRYYQALGSYAPEIHMGVNLGQEAAWANSMVNPPMNLAGRDISFQVNSTVTASWLLFDGFARYLTVQAAKSDYEREEAVRMRVLCMMKRAVAYAYFDIQLASKIQDIQKNNIKFQQELLGAVTPEAKAGRRPEDEVLNFSVLAGTGEVALATATNQRETSDYALAQLMGYAEGELPDNLSLEAFPDDLERMYYGVDSCLDIALKNSPEMHIMRKMLEIAHYNKLKSYSAFFPTVYGDFSYTNTQMNSQYQDYRVNRSSFGRNSLYYGMHADLLLFDGLARYNAMREMQTLFAVAEFQMAEMYLQIVNTIRAAYANYETAYANYQVYRRLLPEAERQRDLVLKRYLDYSAPVDRLDRVQEYYIDVQTQYAVAATDFRKAIAQLEAVMMIDVYSKSPEQSLPADLPDFMRKDASTE